jgi:ACT domain-containing protein
MAKKYHNIGSMKTKKDKDEDGNVQYVIQLDKKYQGKIFVQDEKGKFKPVSEYIQVERPKAKFDRMLKAGKIEDTEYSDKVDQFEKGGKLEFVKFDLQMTTEE